MVGTMSLSKLKYQYSCCI